MPFLIVCPQEMTTLQFQLQCSSQSFFLFSTFSLFINCNWIKMIQLAMALKILWCMKETQPVCSHLQWCNIPVAKLRKATKDHNKKEKYFVWAVSYHTTCGPLVRDLTLCFFGNLKRLCCFRELNFWVTWAEQSKINNVQATSTKSMCTPVS